MLKLAKRFSITLLMKMSLYPFFPQVSYVSTNVIVSNLLRTKTDAGNFYYTWEIIMNCPVCESTELIQGALEAILTSMKCPDCKGNWIHGAEYWKWLEKHGPNLPEMPEPVNDLQSSETGKYLDCPECQFRMSKFLVGHGIGFTLDHCEGCKGIWLDGNEWEALKSRNLHDDLNAMLTQFWQASARREARRKHLEKIYTQKFGAEDFAEIRRVRVWLDNHRNKQELIAFLTDKDPFGI